MSYVNFQLHHASTIITLSKSVLFAFHCHLIPTFSHTSSPFTLMYIPANWITGLRYSPSIWWSRLWCTKACAFLLWQYNDFPSGNCFPWCTLRLLLFFCHLWSNSLCRLLKEVQKPVFKRWKWDDCTHHDDRFFKSIFSLRIQLYLQPVNVSLGYVCYHTDLYFCSPSLWGSVTVAGS